MSKYRVFDLEQLLCSTFTKSVISIFSTDDISVTSASVTDRSSPSPAHLLRSDVPTGVDGHHVYSEDYIGTDKDSDYIYVTYPPDLKRRLLERYSEYVIYVLGLTVKF